MALNNIKKILKAYLEQIQDIEDALQPFYDRLNINTQSGAQLDRIGEIVGQPRGAQDDDVYRQLLYIKIVRNQSEGTPEELIQIFDVITNPEFTIFTEEYPASFRLEAVNPDYLFDFPYIYEAIQKAKPAGVGINSLVESYEPSFAFYDYSGSDATSGFSDVVPPGNPTTGGIFSSLMPTYSIPKIDPLSLSPTGLYTTRRLPNCASAYIMRVYRVTAADEVDVYDVQKGTSNYKLTETGSWIDGSSETFRLVKWYDQSGNSRDFTQSTSANQPSMTFNVFNGWPVIRGDGTDDTLASAATAADFLDADDGTMLVTMATNGSFSSQADVYDLPPLVADDNADLGLYVGEDTTTSETLVWSYNDDGTDDQVGAEFYDGEFYNCVWRHGGGNLLSDIAYCLVTILSSWGSVASGNTASLSGAMKMFGGLAGGGATPFKGDMSEVAIYDYGLTNLQIEGVKRYLKSN